MISKITMNNVSSFKNKAILETNKHANLIYGLNGTGKSTLSNFLYDIKNPCYKNCSIDGIKESDELLVYNTKFVKDYFYESDNIQGIFTLSKTNSRNVAKNKEYKAKYEEARSEQIKIREEISKNEKEFEKNEQDFEENIWQIKKEYHDNSDFKYCFEGIKLHKKNLAEFLLSKQLETYTLSIEQLREKIIQINTNDKKIDKLPFVFNDLYILENSSIFNKVIVGNENSSISDFIKNLNNSDWIKTGIDFLDTSNGRCPFCQQQIDEKIVKEIKEYFDESYNNDLKRLNFIKNEYIEKINKLIDINDISNNEFGKKHIREINKIYSVLNGILKDNIFLIEQKINNPSQIIKLTSTKSQLNYLNEILMKINEEIEEHNEIISHKEKELEKIKHEFWNIIRNNKATVIKYYLTTKNKIEKENQNNLIKKQENLDKLVHLKKLIRETGERENISDSIKNINNNLVRIGISDFQIVEHSEKEALYRLKRDDVSENVFMSLSEGEKMVISFLYFVELCKGFKNKDINDNNKIIVIDDPISSLSHIYVFNIGRIIHNEFLRTDKYEQIFILTHSLYFFYELACMKKEDRDAKQKLFRIEKNSSGSCITSMKYNEIQNDYQEYWKIIKDENQRPALIANCMRNIIEYFFNFVEKIDLGDVFGIAELKEDNRFQAFYRYMNRESHSKGSNIFDIKEFDYNNFKEAFALIFKKTGYEKHYNRMMK